MSYFDPPQDRLDPHLFKDAGKGHMRMSSKARARLLQPLYRYLDGIGLRESIRWLRAWAAGSGVSYQWGNHDLDVLLGIDRVRFNKANPAFAGIGENELAAELDESLRSGLWPATRATDIDGGAYEVTYYYNPDVGTNIRRIHPYAAYDIVNDFWAVEPDPQPQVAYPQEYDELAQRDQDRAQDLLSQYSKSLDTLATSDPRDPTLINTHADIDRTADQASALFNEIHAGRRTAFQGGGSGYADIHNYRWQAAKRSGALAALSSLSAARRQERAAQETKLYGSPLKTADELIRRAELYRRNG